jgi:hypothetical protein
VWLRLRLQAVMVTAAAAVKAAPTGAAAEVAPTRLLTSSLASRPGVLQLWWWRYRYGFNLFLNPTADPCRGPCAWFAQHQPGSACVTQRTRCGCHVLCGGTRSQTTGKATPNITLAQLGRCGDLARVLACSRVCVRRLRWRTVHLRPHAPPCLATIVVSHSAAEPAATRAVVALHRCVMSTFVVGMPSKLKASRLPDACSVFIAVCVRAFVAGVQRSNDATHLFCSVEPLCVAIVCRHRTMRRIM